MMTFQGLQLEMAFPISPLKTSLFHLQITDSSKS